MLQVTGHGKDVFDMSYQSAITEFINREKKCIKRWEMKYKPMFEKKWKEHKMRYLNKPQTVGRTIGRIGSTSAPTYRCIGWGITKMDKRTADKEIAGGGLSHYNDGEEYYTKPSEYKRSVHGRTKALSTAFYDTNGIYSFGGDVIQKQGAEIEKYHERELLRIENLRRRMGMYDSQKGHTKVKPGEEQTGTTKEGGGGGEEEVVQPCLSDVSEPIEDLGDSLDNIEEEKEEKEVRKEEQKTRSSVPVVVPELAMEKVSSSRRSSRKTTGRSSRRSTGRSSRSQRNEEEEEEPVVEKKKESVFKRALRARKGRKKQKISAFNSYANPLYPRFSSYDTPRSTTSATSGTSSARKRKKGGRKTPRHEEIMRKLEARMEKKQYGGNLY